MDIFLCKEKEEKARLLLNLFIKLNADNQSEESLAELLNKKNLKEVSDEFDWNLHLCAYDQSSKLIAKVLSSGKLRIVVRLFGTIGLHPFLKAFKETFPKSEIKYFAAQTNINSYNLYGGPWTNQYLFGESVIYYLSKTKNSLSFIKGEDNVQVQAWLDNNVEDLIDYKVVHSKEYVHRDFFDERFYEKKSQEAYIHYDWYISELDSSAMDWLENNLSQVTMSRAMMNLDSVVQLTAEEQICRVEAEQMNWNRGTVLHLSSTVPGTLSYTPLIKAIKEKYPKAQIHFIGVHTDISTYNYYGGPWTNFDSERCFIYYLKSGRTNAELYSCDSECEAIDWLNSNLEKLIDYKCIFKKDYLHIDPFDERFFKEKAFGAQIHYDWFLSRIHRHNMDDLLKTLRNKTLGEVLQDLGWDDDLNENEESCLLKVEKNENYLMISAELPGIFNVNHPLACALRKHYPHSLIRVRAWQTDINSYNRYGGPWTNVCDSDKALIYYLTDNKNSYRLIDLSQKNEYEWMMWLRNNIKGLINFKIIPIDKWEQALDVKDVRFYEETQEAPQICYDWIIEGLSDDKIDSFWNLSEKSMSEIIDNLKWNGKISDEEKECVLFIYRGDKIKQNVRMLLNDDGVFKGVRNIKEEKEAIVEDNLPLHIQYVKRGHFKAYSSVIQAIHDKYPEATYSYCAWATNINFYNSYGGPWTNRNDFEDIEIRYTFFDDFNGCSIVEKSDMKSLISDFNLFNSGLINYKVVPSNNFEKQAIEWDMENRNGQPIQQKKYQDLKKVGDSKEEGYFSERLEKLISSALMDGVLTEKEKDVILRRAEKEGEDEDEVMIIIRSRLKKIKKI